MRFDEWGDQFGEERVVKGNRQNLRSAEKAADGRGEEHDESTASTNRRTTMPATRQNGPTFEAYVGLGSRPPFAGIFR